jgi:3-phosphoshikimate 1-carboxyvinyltransferase
MPLLDALKNLGVKIIPINSRNSDCPPFIIQGPIQGGKTTVDARSSQYISSLLISCPLANGDSQIKVENVCEIPYIEMTLSWLDDMGIRYERDGFDFRIKGKQSYPHFEKKIPSDWSTAAFPIIAAAIIDSDVTIKGLDINDVQGDKKIIDYLQQMGATFEFSDNGIRIINSSLSGCMLDLNDTPDALPAVCIAACMANGKTTIRNIAHARLKETDRIKVMHDELKKLGADVTGLEDGLIINGNEGKDLHSSEVDGHMDHRIIMALSILGMTIENGLRVKNADAISVTYPDFIYDMQDLGMKISLK